MGPGHTTVCHRQLCGLLDVAATRRVLTITPSLKGARLKGAGANTFSFFERCLKGAGADTFSFFG
jgi:hypothetical protein